MEVACLLQAGLNLAECELSALTRQGLDRRIPDLETLRRETASWEHRRNATQKGVDWRFTTDWSLE